jgi:hypothetical protein
VVSSTFTAAVVADRAHYKASTNPAPVDIAKSYTVVMPPVLPMVNQQNPRGFGVGKVKIGADGIARFKGTLPDGTKATFNQPLSKDNQWPLFLNLYKKKGVLLGNVTIDTAQPTSDMNGTFDWYKPVATKDLFFPLGFKIEDGDFFASIYTAPLPGLPALAGYDSTNARVILEEGSLLASFEKAVSFVANKVAVTVPGDDKLALQIVASTGDLRGTFTHPVSGKRVVITGVLFQKAQEAYGFFPGSSVPGVNPQTGRVTFTKPVPPAP